MVCRGVLSCLKAHCVSCGVSCFMGSYGDLLYGCCVLFHGVLYNLFNEVFHCFMRCSSVLWGVSCGVMSGLGPGPVSWGVVLFHRVLYYFMGCCIVSWGVPLFHGVS